MLRFAVDLAKEVLGLDTFTEIEILQKEVLMVEMEVEEGI
jgi:hypothetical protein